MYHELKTEFLQHLLSQMFETSCYVQKLTVQMVISEDNEHQTHQTISQTAWLGVWKIAH